MGFKIGDIVIKKTGGNKMTISDIINQSYKCIWFLDNKLNELILNDSDLTTPTDYKKIYLKAEERDDKIKKLLN